MSMQRDRAYLRADLAELDRLIAGCDADEEITKLGFEARRAEVEQELRDSEAKRGAVARATLIFRGAPVLGTSGIEADFGGQILESFQKLIAKSAAARAGHTLGTRGPIPDLDTSKLFLTGTASGSFGFVLEEATDIPLFGPTPLAEAVEDAGRLLRATQDDEQFGEAVSQADPEVIGALSKFLGVVASREATVRMETGEVTVSFDDAAIVQAALERTSSVREEADKPVGGTLEGLLPTARRFELRLVDTGELISGRVARTILNPEAFKAFVDQECTAHLRVITFQRPGREHRRYELLSLEPKAKSSP